MNHSHITILKTGPGTSIQDLGRIGYAEFGIPISGVMDQKSMNWVNHLLRNHKNAAVMEICQPGLQLLFNEPTTICIAGALAEVKVNSRKVRSEGLLNIKIGDILEVGKFEFGAIIYLGIKEGFQSKLFLNSKSFYKGISKISMLKKGDQVSYLSFDDFSFSSAHVKYPRKWMKENEIMAYPGPEWASLDRSSQNLLEKTLFTLANSINRMAFQVEELLNNELPEMHTAPVYPGTIQLTSGGKLLILMKDAQVTGGYPRVLQLTEESISILAQKKPKDQFHFKIKRP